MNARAGSKKGVGTRTGTELCGCESTMCAVSGLLLKVKVLTLKHISPLPTQKDRRDGCFLATASTNANATFSFPFFQLGNCILSV